MIGLTKLQGFYLKLDGDFKHALLTNARRKLKTWIEVARQLKNYRFDIVFNKKYEECERGMD